MTAREKFRVGDRVRLNEAGLKVRPKGSSAGTVAGHCRDERLVRVLWDGYSAPQAWSVTFLERVDPGFDPVYLGM